MPSLHEATDMTKKVLVFGVVGIVALTILWFLIKFIGGLFAAPPIPPSSGYGKLAPIAFPKSVTNQKFTFNVQTVTGSLPEFPDRIKVYKIIKPTPDLLALPNAISEVQTLNFTDPPKRITESMYEWHDWSAMPRTLDLDIFMNDFDLQSAYATDSAVLQSENLPTSDDDAISAAKDFFTAITQAFPDSLSPGDSHYYNINGKKLIDAPSISAAQIIRIDFYQADIDKTKVYYPNYPFSLINASIAGGDSQAQVVDAHYRYRDIDTKDQAETYPIITAQQALDELKKGQAYIPEYDGTGSNITITSISLGYYMSANPDYLMPIIVMQGNDNFTAFIPAIPDSSRQK